jgi:hypothetical protein
MANVITNPTFFPRRLSSYVPAMAYASDVNMSGESRVSFGAPGLANPTFFLNALSVAAAQVVPATSLLNNATVDAPFGRPLQVVCSAAGTGTVIVDGYDYLMQPMSENLVLNGTTVVFGNKAFFLIRQVTIPLVGAVTLNLGTGSRLGLPYKGGRVLTEEFAGAVVATLGTLTAPVLTVPATATTGDTRGTYAPQSTLNGTSTLTATFEFYGDVDSGNNGGLFGVPQYTN